MKRWFIFLLVALFIGCGNDSRGLERFDDLKNYYEYAFDQQPVAQGIVVLIQNSRCVACAEETIFGYFDELKMKEAPKDFILSRYDRQLDSLIQEVDNSRVFIDSLGLKSDFGLDYGANLFFIIDGDAGDEWHEMKWNNLEKLAHIR